MFVLDRRVEEVAKSHKLGRNLLQFPLPPRKSGKNQFVKGKIAPREKCYCLREWGGKGFGMAILRGGKDNSDDDDALKHKSEDSTSRQKSCIV